MQSSFERRPLVGSQHGALGDVRLLRDADRLERRDRARARAAVWADAPARAAPLPRARAGDPARGSVAELPRGDGDRARAARRAGRRARRARPRRCRAGSRSRRFRPRSRRCASRGWRLAILSNSDRDLIDASVARLGVPFDETIVASEIGSYKPAPAHWDEFFARTGADRAGHVHVAASLFHDIAPATALGLRTVWINRLGETAEPQPDVELQSLDGLADALDMLVP